MSGSAPAAGLLLIALLSGTALSQDGEPPVQTAPRAGGSSSTTTPPVGPRVKEGVRLYRRMHTAVVGISVTTRAYALPALGLRGVTESSAGRVAEELDGSGIVVSAHGHIATVHRLVANAATIEVRFTDGSTRVATSAGSLPSMGIALLQVDDLPRGTAVVRDAMEIARDGTTQAWFLAGSADESADGPDLEPVEARYRGSVGTAYDAFVSARLKLAAGAAGGALLDSEGHLLGMAVGSSYRVDPESGEPQPTTLFVQGADVRRAVDDMVRGGRLERPMLGVLLNEQTNRVDLVLPGGPAERAGLLEGDVVRAIGDAPCRGSTCVSRALLRRRVGEAVRLTIVRNGEELERTVELAAAAEPPPSSEPPLPGAALEVTAVPAHDGPLDFRVVVRSVESGSVLHLAGVREGDELLDVDGRTPLSFLMRHRFRPQTGLPATLRVRRGSAIHTFELSD